ncbi:MAG: DNA polymerase Y family protein, partial [Alphaproteobacteria bacterium]|nr:DNA polymerase Y family protein [Alphaproteobacteria bacterium]
MHGVRRIAAVGPDGPEAGLRPGQTLTDARAVCPGLVAYEADPAADAAALVALAAWCERYTPLAATDPPDGIWLDITGSAHLFGTEESLAGELAGRLAHRAAPCRVGIASTTGAAWALAHASFAPTLAIVPQGDERAALADVPVAGLRLDAVTLARLRRLGLRTVGALARLPRAEITARFGPLPVLRLDQAFGTVAEAIAWPHPPAPFAVRLAFAEPIGTQEALARALARLTDRLCRTLAEQDRGSHRLVARFFRVDGADQRIAVTTSRPARTPKHLTRLLEEQLERVDPGFGVEAIVLEAEETAPLGAPQTELLAAPDPGQTVAETIDRLANRFGAARIWRAAPEESHVPERAVRAAPSLDAAPSWTAGSPIRSRIGSPAGSPICERNESTGDRGVLRPIRLLRRPEPIEVTAPVPDDPPILFRWRGSLHRIRAATGPERIGAEWWRLRDPHERQVPNSPANW